jgi:hypothetical protein
VRCGSRLCCVWVLSGGSNRSGCPLLLLLLAQPAALLAWLAKRTAESSKGQQSTEIRDAQTKTAKIERRRKRMEEERPHPCMLCAQTDECQSCAPSGLSARNCSARQMARKAGRSVRLGSERRVRGLRESGGGSTDDLASRLLLCCASAGPVESRELAASSGRDPN